MQTRTSYCQATQLINAMTLATLSLAGLAAAEPAPFAAETVIDSNFLSATSVAAADLDGDGDLDILGAAVDTDTVCWWESTAGDGKAWQRHTIDASFSAAESVVPADIDGDGDADILGGGGGEIAWWENRLQDGAGTSWTRHLVAIAAEVIEVAAADVDADGDLDILGAVYSDGKVSWWEQQASGWTEHTVDHNATDASAVAAADIDQDGDLDLLAARAGSIAWWQNPKNAADGNTGWTEQTIDAAFAGGETLVTADLDADGDIDVIGASRNLNQVVWWENRSHGATWVEHSVSDDFYGAYALAIADLDQDGDLDILGAANTADDIAWWENTAAGASWHEHTVTGAFDGALAVAIADLDGDGDNDVLAAAINADTIAWWENNLELPAAAPHSGQLTLAADLDDTTKDNPDSV